MQKILALAVVAIFMMATTAFAQVRVFTQASGPGFDQFVEQLADGELLVDGRFPSAVLGVIAYDFAVENGHLTLVSENYRERAAYANLFIRWNGLQETISLRFFQRKGQGTGFWLPVVSGGGSPATTATAPAPAVADIVNAALEARGLAALDAFTSLQAAQLTAGDVRTIVRTELGNQAVPQSFITAVVNEVEPRLEAFTERLSATEAEVAIISAQVLQQAAQLTALDERFAVVENEVTAVSTQVLRQAEQLAIVNDTLFDADGNVRFATSEEVNSTISTALTEAGLVDQNGQAVVSITPWGLIAWLTALTMVIAALGLVLTRVRRTAGENQQSLTDLADSRVEFDSENQTLEELKDLKPGERAFWRAYLGGKTFQVTIWREEGDAAGLVRTDLCRSATSQERVTDPFSLKRGFHEKLRRAIFEGRAKQAYMPPAKFAGANKAA